MEGDHLEEEFLPGMICNLTGYLPNRMFRFAAPCFLSDQESKALDTWNAPASSDELQSSTVTVVGLIESFRGYSVGDVCWPGCLSHITTIDIHYLSLRWKRISVFWKLGIWFFYIRRNGGLENTTVKAEKVGVGSVKILKLKIKW